MTYEDIRSAFRWEVPATFNFAADVVDAWAKDPAKLALAWCDESGREERYTYAKIAELSRRLGNVLRALKEIAVRRMSRQRRRHGAPPKVSSRNSTIAATFGERCRP